MSAPYYSDDLVTLYHGDNREVLPTLSDVDLIVTSPPYNLGVTTGGGFRPLQGGSEARRTARRLDQGVLDFGEVSA